MALFVALFISKTSFQNTPIGLGRHVFDKITVDFSIEDYIEYYMVLFKIQLVCHIEFFRRKRNKMSEETMWPAYRAQQIQPQAKGMIYGSPGR